MRNSKGKRDRGTFDLDKCAPLRSKYRGSRRHEKFLRAGRWVRRSIGMPEIGWFRVPDAALAPEYLPGERVFVEGLRAGRDDGPHQGNVCLVRRKGGDRKHPAAPVLRVFLAESVHFTCGTVTDILPPRFATLGNEVSEPADAFKVLGVVTLHLRDMADGQYHVLDPRKGTCVSREGIAFQVANAIDAPGMVYAFGQVNPRDPAPVTDADREAVRVAAAERAKPPEERARDRARDNAECPDLQEVSPGIAEVRVEGDHLAPRFPAGTVLRVQLGRMPEAGEVVVYHGGKDRDGKVIRALGVCEVSKGVKVAAHPNGIPRPLPILDAPWVDGTVVEVLAPPAAA